MKPKTIVFDLDGTLISTMEGFADIAADLIQQNFGWDFSKARKAYIQTSGIPFCKQLEVIFPGDQRNLLVSQKFESRKLVHFFDEPPSNQVIQMLKSLNSSKYRCVISSNNCEDVVFKYANLHFSELFVLVLGYREGFSKGQPHFDEIKRNLDISQDEILFVADSLSDLKMARSLKINFVGVEGVFTASDFHSIDSKTPVLSHVSNLTEFLLARDSSL